ncbi:Cof-type HAD-IIB family hydrolase [Histomonas meleagridis]|uniref:Cof-type HAD-IIB family hydrolase n=1 Tax=Histomonas meleagridis TaxID=135588 RepID=UPI00355A45BA|nr:Cof-type HAD-IIB family hydrolase [Histomonas meleagridis]KAH0802896.1 Cof-type HAD-IIB family hydrolase [Histomonas meleagridis]
MMKGEKVIKILYTDLDGTLLNSQKQISNYTKEIFDLWNKAGNKLVLSSGRDINSIKEVRKSLGLLYPGMYLIGYNGGQIYECDTNQTIYRVSLTLEQTHHIMEEAKIHGIHCHTYSDTNIVSSSDDEELHYYKRVITTPVIISENVTDVLKEGPCKCIAIDTKNPERLENLRKSLLDWCNKENISMTYSNPYYLEVFPSASGKGNAVTKLNEILQIDRMNSIAAGDALNDLSMIEAAGVGIAMVNACEELKKAALITTHDDNDHDGLAKCILNLI